MGKNVEIKLENEFSPLPDTSPAKVIIAGNTAEIKTMKYKPCMKGLQNTVRCSGNTYLCIDTGEIKEYSKELDRSENPHLKETLKKIRLYINANFYDGGQFWTLSYNQCMTDIATAKKDLQTFLRSLCKQYGKLMYFWVLEPKASGAWHYHILVKGVELTAQEVSKLWGHGSVDVQDIYDVKGLAWYVAPNCKKAIEEGADEDGGIFVLSKSAEKSERLSFYPANARIYGKSNSVRKWIEEDTTRGEAGKYIGDKKRIRKYTVKISEADTGREINQINHEFFEG